MHTFVNSLIRERQHFHVGCLCVCEPTVNSQAKQPLLLRRALMRFAPKMVLGNRPADRCVSAGLGSRRAAAASPPPCGGPFPMAVFPGSEDADHAWGPAEGGGRMDPGQGNAQCMCFLGTFERGNSTLASKVFSGGGGRSFHWRWFATRPRYVQ